MAWSRTARIVGVCSGLLACTNAPGADEGSAGGSATFGQQTVWQMPPPLLNQGMPDGGTGVGASDASQTVLPTPDAGSDSGSRDVEDLQPVDAGSLADCPAAPAGSDPQAVEALNAVNTLRLPAGAGCMAMVATINDAAQNHCDYYASNSGSCIADPHSEVSSCTGFTGQSAGDRMKAAGYSGRSWSEVMAFVDDAQSSVSTWVNSIWHRVPILDPWTTEMGYGHATRCDTIDFGAGSTGLPEDAVVVYPYAQQTGLPTSFDGSREGPMPPAPPTGWPSASPVTVYANGMTITEHTLTVDGDPTPLDHVWLTAADSNFLRRSVFLYGNAPFAAQTTYRVRIVGSYVGGPLELEWTFTTGDASRRF